MIRTLFTEKKFRWLHDIRKVTALGVVCMEQHGSPYRDPE